MEIKIEDEMTHIADNVMVANSDGKLVIVIDMEKTIGPSSSGKMMGIASTGGFTRLPFTSSRGKYPKINLYIGE